MELQELMCPICSEQFMQKRPNMTFCSKRCANIAANRAARLRERSAEKKKRARVRVSEIQFDCPHNKAITCGMMKCSTCGWNPKVAKQRLEALHG